MPLLTFLAVLVLHALYVRHISATVADGWADTGIKETELWGLKPYLQAQDYYLGFSYALGLAFAVWSVGQSILSRRAAMAAGAAGSLTLVGVFMAAGCFLLGCCGSPLLAVYVGLFGVKALGVGKPLMALVTLLSVGCGYWCLSRRFAHGSCGDRGCN